MKQFYLFKCVKNKTVLYVGATSCNIKDRLSDLKRKHKNNDFLEGVKTYYFVCKNKEFMDQMKLGAVLFYKPPYNRRCKQTNIDAISINFDTLDWKEYGQIEENPTKENQIKRQKIINFERYSTPTAPVSLDKWGFLCPENIELTNEHLELLSYVYGHPSIGGIPLMYYEESDFRVMEIRYKGGWDEVIKLLEDLSQISVLAPNTLPNVNIVDNKIPLILYRKDKVFVQINEQHWRKLYQMVKEIMSSSEFYIWHEEDIKKIENCWVSQAKYNPCWGFQFLNPLLKYEIDLSLIYKRMRHFAA